MKIVIANIILYKINNTNFGVSVIWQASFVEFSDPKKERKFLWIPLIWYADFHHLIK